MKRFFSIVLFIVSFSSAASAGYSEAIESVINSVYSNKNVTVVSKVNLVDYCHNSEVDIKRGQEISKFQSQNIIGGRYNHSVYRVSENTFCEFVSPSNNCDCFTVHSLED